MISLIISFYKRLDFLELIFKALDAQSCNDFEVIIAEDNNDPQAAIFIDEARLIHSYIIKHVYQEDIGFRKTRILNSAIRIAEGEKLVFIDGDCIPHKHFIKEYNKAIEESYFCYGRRVYCSNKHTGLLLKSSNPASINIFNIILYGGRSVGAGLYLPFKKNINKQHRRILGCNWGVLKNNILAVNGFDEDYNRAGVGEDFDVDWRLKKIGFKVRSMKGKAIVYHLDHKANYLTTDTEYVEKLLIQKKEIGKSYCENGLFPVKKE
jgi:cellulose synthase/poly-beta-1,6-N-acetylglucosamine synthase-like glycosyltransferase